MCIGYPMQIIKLDGSNAICDHNGLSEEVDIALLENPQINDWVLVFLGGARKILTPQEAHDIANAIDGLRASFDGDNIDVFFEDLIDREPQLPEHMQAAFKSGAKTA